MPTVESADCWPTASIAGMSPDSDTQPPSAKRPEPARPSQDVTTATSPASPEPQLAPSPEMRQLAPTTRLYCVRPTQHRLEHPERTPGSRKSVPRTAPVTQA